MKSRVTMAKVASRARVHVTTVSLALRNHPSLPATTRTRLQGLARKMGYRSDPALRALMAYRRSELRARIVPTLAYLTNRETARAWQESRAHRDFFTGAKAKARYLGYRVEHFWLGEPGLTHRQMSDRLLGRGISGVIIASHRYESEMPLTFEWSRFSAVKIDFFPHEPDLHRVTNDQRAIIQLAVKRVRAAGYRRVGFVMNSVWDFGVDCAWSAGFLADQQLRPPEERVPILFFPDAVPTPHQRRPDDGAMVSREAFAAWYGVHRPEVVISHAPFVQPHFAALNLNVPRDFAFVDILLEDRSGQLAGVRQNCRRVGEVAVELLASQIQQDVYGAPKLPTCTLVAGTWISGASLPSRAENRVRQNEPPMLAYA